MKLGNDRNGATTYDDVTKALKSGESLLVEGVPGSGKTQLAVDLASAALGRGDSDQWAPVLVITPDRRRSASLDLLIANALTAKSGRVIEAPGNHRLVRSLNSYAHLVTGLWRVERENPLSALSFTSGAKEDSWVADYLNKVRSKWADIYGPAVLESPSFRMEIRNVVARSGELGLLPEDLGWLGSEFSKPFWELSSDAYAAYAGAGNLPFGLDTPHVDSARLPRIAAGILRDWDAKATSEAVISMRPTPDVLIVDDVQDLTDSALPLIKQAAQYAKQVVLLSSSLSATADFRGGNPDLGGELAGMLGLEVVRLDQNLRSTAGIKRVADEVSSWLKPSDAAWKRNDSGFPSRQKPDVTCDWSATETKRDMLISQHLRRHHIEDQIPWTNMAVLVRRSQEIEPLRRRLARSDIPLQPANRPVQLSKVPICAALLRVLEVGGRVGGGDFDPISDQDLQDAAQQLVASPLVNADSLATFRLIRDLRSLDLWSGNDKLVGTLDLLEIPDDQLDLLERPGNPSRTRVLKTIRRARRIWRIKSEAAAKPAQIGLWALWDSADVVDSLRKRALDTRTQHRVDSQIAGDALDAVLALFRKADLWQQEQAERGLDETVLATAFDFATETLKQTVSTDSLAKSGLSRAGVSVVTASQAAGSQWDVVCIVGPQLGAWPSGGGESLADLGRLRLLIDDAESRGWCGETQIKDHLPDLSVGKAMNRVQANYQRRANDARLFHSAVTRARTALHFVVVSNSEDSESVFVDALMESGALPPKPLDRNEELVYTEPEVDLDMGSLVASLRRNAISDHSSREHQDQATELLALLALEGIEAANPGSWMGAGSLSTDAPLIEGGKIPLAPSSLKYVEECQLRWFMGLIRGEDVETSEDPERFDKAALGTLIHEIAEEKPNGTPEELQEALNEKWGRLGLSDEDHWGRYWYGRAQKMVSLLATHLSTWTGEVQVEESMKFEVGDGVIRGRIDRLEHLPGGAVRVIDIKTGTAESQNSVAKNQQLIAYQVGVDSMGYRSGGAGLLQVGEKKKTPLVLQVALDPQEIEEHRKRFEDLAASLSGVTLKAQPTNACEKCPFAKACAAVRGKKAE